MSESKASTNFGDERVFRRLEAHFQEKEREFQEMKHSCLPVIRRRRVHHEIKE
jgi:hypothetical protein